MNTITSTPPQVDLETGMCAYSTTGPRYGGPRLRVRFEDFQVEELIEIDEIVDEKRPGLVPVYRVKKTGIDTPHMSAEMSRILRSEVNFAGLKDRNAVAVQYVSARSGRAESPVELKGSRFEAKLLGYSRPIVRRMLQGNRFSILIATAPSDEHLEESIDRVFEACRDRRVANFFGYQRFGLRALVNHRAGKALVERDFRRAVRLILAEPREAEGEEAAMARQLALEERYREASALFSPGQDLERRIVVRLSENPQDYLGALRRISLPVRRLLVQSYQAYLFNVTLSTAVSRGLDIGRALPGDNWAAMNPGGLGVGRVHGVKEVPPTLQTPDTDSSPSSHHSQQNIPLIQLVGYAHRDYRSRFDEILNEVLAAEGVSPSRFYIKEAEEISTEGGFRAAPLLSMALSHTREARGHRVEFSLGKGEYATVILREILKPDDPLRGGF